MNTKKEIVDKCYKILGEEQSSTVFDKEGEVVPRINEVIDKITRCNVTNILTGQKIRGGILNFLYDDRTIKIPRVKKNLEDIDINTRSILLDSIEGLPRKGYLCINGNVISYDGIDETNNSIMKVNGINGPHEHNSSLYFAYILPENLIKASDFFDVDFEDVLKFIDFRERPQSYERCYTIKPYKGRSMCIFFNMESNVLISFTKKLEPMVNDDDECGLPDDYGKNIVPNLVIGELLIDTSEVAKGEKLLAVGYAELEDMYSYYATPTKQFRKKIKTTPLKNNLPR